jgi:hypothetical protein
MLVDCCWVSRSLTLLSLLANTYRLPHLGLWPRGLTVRRLPRVQYIEIAGGDLFVV